MKTKWGLYIEGTLLSVFGAYFDLRKMDPKESGDCESPLRTCYTAMSIPKSLNRFPICQDLGTVSELTTSQSTITNATGLRDVKGGRGEVFGPSAFTHTHTHTHTHTQFFSKAKHFPKTIFFRSSINRRVKLQLLLFLSLSLSLSMAVSSSGECVCIQVMEKISKPNNPLFHWFKWGQRRVCVCGECVSE